MPISIEEYRVPKFIRIRPTYPFTDDPKAKYIDGNDRPRSYKGRTQFPQQGYNPHSNRATPEHININTEDLILPPY